MREVRGADAEGLASLFADPAVREFVAPAPSSVEGFRRFTTWVRRERRAGRLLSYSIVDERGRVAGLMQLWPVDASFSTAEWGAAIARESWGHGVFGEAARLLMRFAFETLGVRRLECRAAAANGRWRAALTALGAVEEGTLRECFPCGEGASRVDYVMYSILSREWAAPRHAGDQAER
jgi:RimJ/RimL family protein N-acetyltransferase